MTSVLHITGFESQEHAECFTEWFCESGEQDFSLWLEERGPDLKPPVSDILHSYSQLDGNDMIMVVKTFL